MRQDGLTTARWIALLVPLGLMAGALGSQYIGGLYPCEMCHWQRWPHYAAIPVAAAAFFVKQRPAQLALVLLAGLLVAVSGAIGVFHAGVEYHWWQGITPCTARAGAGMSGADLLDAIRKAPLVRCDAPQWSLFGISLAGFNAIISLAGAVAVFVLALRRAR
ncbi:disulfide bond formation protein B [Sphingomonas sp. AOB5]|uniref:disulfide bond formation protein B n=1 Tax=Sphingomonas sp. AOB5 TaxID=3034017 RepID=UPI0023F938ED|nr:disulfide bond formation protein B [Sphingomonas sp. AOB5]MDF7777771.1 disulfide bond formation protein B [Sphingomonas sp. AOB5]